MASLPASAGAGALGLTFASGFGVGLLGFALVGAAGFIDSRYIYPAILGNKGNARPRSLLDVPTMTAAPGTPRIWAMGRRIRVPVHVMFQSTKIRESGSGGAKGGVANRVRRAFADVGLALNDRPTSQIAQLIGSGKLLYWRDRNFVVTKSSNMIASESSGRLVLTMVSNVEPDFADKLTVDDRVILSGFNPNGGPSIEGIWKVHAVSHHGNAPSSVSLDIYAAQSLTSLSATAGTDQHPASVTRLDDGVAEHTWTTPFTSTTILHFADADQRARFEAVFAEGDVVQLSGGFHSSLHGIDWTVVNLVAGNVQFRGPSGFANVSAGTGTSTNAGVVRFTGSRTYVPGLFASGFDPRDAFYSGDDEQTEDAIIARHETTGTIPGFRGLCYQMLDQLDESTYFGNQLPLFEAALDIDPTMNWQEAFVVLCGRYGFAAEELDVSGVTPKPFEGMYLLGSVVGTTALQPMLLAGQIATQERDGVLAFFQIENADVVQIENGAAFSDLGTRSGGGTPNSGDKLRHSQAAQEDLPTSIGVKHQDVDNVYAGGFQPFGLRQPTATGHVNETEVDLGQLALTRKEARNIAGTIMRRTWTNANTVEMQLPVAYLEVLENDLLTVTDDDGNDLLVRVIRREVGANFVVNIVGVREHLALQVTGSPVQGAGLPQPPIVQSVIPRVHVLDIPPLVDADRFTPGIYLAACSTGGGHWAGVSVFESRDGGTSYSLVRTITTESGCGELTTQLDLETTPGEAADGTVTWDDANTVEVQLDSDGPFPPVTVTEADVLGGVNWCHIDDGAGNWEILGFRDVTDNGDGSYTLAHLLRGLRGTYAGQIVDKAEGSTVTMLTAATSSAVFHPLASTDVPVSLKFKFVPTGMTLADVEAVDVDAEGWNARPMPVRDFDNNNDGSNNRTFTLRHWSRVNHPVGFTGPFALDEAHEGYRIRIYDPTGATLLRVKHRDSRLTGSPTLASAAFIYTAAEQTTDGYTPGGSETFWVELEQLGDFGINTASGSVERRGGRTYRQEM